VLRSVSSSTNCTGHLLIDKNVKEKRRIKRYSKMEEFIFLLKNYIKAIKIFVYLQVAEI